jgi:hypothetical protein
MKAEQINIKIAEACGWKQHPEDGIIGCWDDNEGFTKANIPNYYSDLNACHEAVMSISLKEKPEWCPLEYTDNLLIVVNLSATHCVERGSFKHTNATAPQRCEAFLKTLGLWEEDS